MNLKKVIAIIIVFSMVMAYSYVYAENEEKTIEQEWTPIVPSEMSYSLIDGDLTNDTSLTEPNIQFSSLLKFFSNGEFINSLIMPQNSRVTIDYSNDIFKIKASEIIDDDYIKTAAEGDESAYNITINPERTEINGTDMRFYGSYVDENGQIREIKSPIVELYLYTSGEKNRIISERGGDNPNYNGNGNYVRYEVGMSIEDFKTDYINTLNDRIKTMASEIAYLNNNGEFKINYYTLKCSNLLVKDNNNSNIESGKMCTGMRFTCSIDMDLETVPKDIEFDWEAYNNYNQIGGFNEEIELVVPGDLTGKGEIDVTDVSTMQEELVESIELEGAYEQAADMDESGEVDIVDLSQLQEYIVNN